MWALTGVSLSEVERRPVKSAQRLETLEEENRRLKSDRDRHNRLYEGFPQLVAFHRELAWIWEDAHTLTNTGDDYGTRIRTAGNGEPGGSSRRQRHRHQRTQRRLVEWTELLANDRSSRSGGPRPRCWAGQGLHKRGLYMPYGSTLCSVCGSKLVNSHARRGVHRES